MTPWQHEPLFKTPRVHETDECSVKGLRSFFYEGLEYKARPTRVFAYYGLPSGEAPVGGWPSVVCVHGGGGTAFPEWVQMWMDRGYAALAMDLEGHLPKGEYPNREWHENAGPARVMAFGDIELADREQWFYHAVADVARAGSLLGSFPGIHAGKIGVQGISWGGVITAAVSGVDTRWAFAIHVYGCGFLHEARTDCFRSMFQHMNPALLTAYQSKWDPSVHLPHATMPTLWMNGTNDQAFPVDAWLKSTRASGGSRVLCMPIRMPHGHGEAGWGRKEIYAFADSVVRGAPPLPKVGRVLLEGTRALAPVDSATTVAKAELCYTLGSGEWLRREWRTARANLEQNVISAAIPPGSTAVFFSVSDERGLMVSSEHLVLADDDLR